MQRLVSLRLSITKLADYIYLLFAAMNYRNSAHRGSPSVEKTYDLQDVVRYLRTIRRIEKGDVIKDLKAEIRLVKCQDGTLETVEHWQDRLGLPNHMKRHLILSPSNRSILEGERKATATFFNTYWATEASRGQPSEYPVLASAQLETIAKSEPEEAYIPIPSASTGKRPLNHSSDADSSDDESGGRKKRKMSGSSSKLNVIPPDASRIPRQHKDSIFLNHHRKKLSAVECTLKAAEARANEAQAENEKLKATILHLNGRVNVLQQRLTRYTGDLIKERVTRRKVERVAAMDGQALRSALRIVQERLEERRGDVGDDY